MTTPFFVLLHQRTRLDNMFEFKQFTIQQDKCAMKVGTDGVLLGAWTPIDRPIDTILDIGSGTGLLALMMAQRTNAQEIDAIEIDQEAYIQSVENFEASPWADRLFCYHTDLETFANEMDQTYDLIISNPPFFTEDTNSQDPKRDLARNEQSLPFELLVEAVEYFLAPQGIFSVIVPIGQEEKIMHLAAQYHIYPFKVTRVKGTEDTPIKRSLIAFSRDLINQIPLNDLVLEEKRHTYTAEYQDITKDFYLKL